MADGGQRTTGGDAAGVSVTLTPVPGAPGRTRAPGADGPAGPLDGAAGPLDGAAEPLLGPPPPRRWLAPAAAAAVLVVIAVGVTVRSGGRVTGPDAVSAAVTTIAPSPPLPSSVSPAPGAPVATGPISSPASTPTSTTPPEPTVPPLGDGDPLLGEPLALSLYAAHPARADAPAYLERVDVDSGVRTRIAYDHADRVRRLVVVGDELVVIGDEIAAIGPKGERTVLGGQGFERSIHGDIASMIVTDNGRTVLRIVNVRERSAPVDVPLPAGTTRAYPDGAGRIVYERPGSGPNGGGVYWTPANGTGEAHATGWGSLRSAERGKFQEAACEGARCRLMLHDLNDETVKTIYDGEGALDTVGVSDVWANYVWMATAPSKSNGTSVLLRVPDGVTFTLPVALAPQAHCEIEPCPAALPVWSDGGESLWGVDTDRHAFGWRPGLETPVRLPDLGITDAVAVGANDAGPMAA